MKIFQSRDTSTHEIFMKGGLATPRIYMGTAPNYYHIGTVSQ